MSKRISFTQEDIDLLVYVLEKFVSPITPYNIIEKFAVERKNQLLNKLKSQHPRSVETLGVSGNGDGESITKNLKKEKN